MNFFELKQNPIQDINQTYQSILLTDQTHPLVNTIDSLKIKGQINFNEKLQMVDVKANVTVFANFLDARYGDNFDDQIEFEWDEEYYFNQANPTPKKNILLNDEFIIEDLAIEQFFLNIPINFSKNYDNINCIGENYALYDEQTYDEQQKNQTDSRWDILKEIKLEQE